MAKVRQRLQLTKNTFLPDFGSFVGLHKESYEWFLKEGLLKAITSVNPITDTLEKMWKLEFVDYDFREPEHTLEECMEYDLTYSYPLYVKVKLTNLQTGKEQVQDVFFANIPAMTPDGYFVINGVVRVVRLQIVRSEGVVFDLGKKKNVPYPYIARLIPQKGSWYTFDISKKGVLTVALVRGRYKVHLTTLLKALKGYSNSQIEKLFADVDEYGFIKETLKYDKTRSREEAVFDIYSRIRPADVVTYDRANRFIRGFFFNARRFYLGEVGRYQLNTKLGLRFKRPRLYVKDIVEIVKHLIKLNKGLISPEDVDDLSNRRIRTVGEVLTEVVEEAMMRFERSVKDRMSRHGADADIAPVALVHNRIVTAQLESFLGINPLSKFMGQLNIFEYIEDLRRITAKGPRGLTGDNATLSVRDIHFSHYSRLGVVASPEGLTGGLISHLAIFAKVNRYGFVEAPYRKLKNEVNATAKELENRIIAEDVKLDRKTVKSGTFIDAKLASSLEKVLKKQDKATVKVFPFLTDEVDYLTYLQEKPKYIGLSSYEHDEYGNYKPDVVLMRHNGDYRYTPIEKMEYVDVRGFQIGSLGFTLVPFVDHTYSYRAMVATNMQRQALPLVLPEAPLVGTGVERLVAQSTGKTILAPEAGKVVASDANYVVFKGKSGKKYEYKVDNFVRTNDETTMTQKVRVAPGDSLKKGDLLIDGPSTDQGELALGRDILVAVMPYEGFNYDDGFAISERLLRDNVFSTVQLKVYTQNLRETSMGPEILTSDIPNVPYELLSNLDANGVIRVGALVKGGDILAGIIAHKGEKMLSPEESLLRAVFGELSKDVKNNSLRMSYGSEGIVIRTEILSRENGDVLPAGVLKRVKVWVAELKRVSYGDKFSGMYGDKGTVAEILPIEDMPYTKDGRTIDLIISPLLVKRMNMGILPQIQYANMAKQLGEYLAVPTFEEQDKELLESLMEKVDKTTFAKQVLYDGRTGKPFENVVTVGYKYIMRLKHIADKKMAARSTGPYSVVTQQPVGGKAHKGGLRFGEMEVWVLEAHNAPYNLQEMLTIKSDDLEGRNRAYRAILEGENIEIRNIPESFNVLLRELNALGIKIDVKKVKEEINKENNEE